MCVCHRNHNYFIKVHPYVYTLTCMLMYVCMFVFMCACGYETQRSITNKPRTCAWCAVGSGVRRATKKPFGRSGFFLIFFLASDQTGLYHTQHLTPMHLPRRPPSGDKQRHTQNDNNHEYSPSNRQSWNII